MRGTATLALFSATAAPAAADVAVVTPGTTNQVIDGFGASSAWTAPTMRGGDADLLFSPKGNGLSLLRVRIQPCTSTNPCVLTTNELAAAQTAASYGVGVWAAPWTPPGAWKINATSMGELDDGILDPQRYDDWASALVAFVQSMKQNGVDLVGLSAQNEPDVKSPGHEACGYCAATLADFVSHLGRAFQAANLIGDGSHFRLIGPET
ncbi:MAG: hypothetical protein JOZ69_08030 [Myxococcales bacterium]|nr:hypothetical protein [Myxococcales bacterium]